MKADHEKWCGDPSRADKFTYRCAVLPHEVWLRQRRQILEMAKRILYERDAAQMAERRAGDKAAGKAADRASGR